MQTYSKPRHVWRALYPLLILMSGSIIAVFVMTAVKTVSGGTPDPNNVAEIFPFETIVKIILIPVFVFMWLSTRKHTQFEGGRLKFVPALLIIGTGLGIGFFMEYLERISGLANLSPDFEQAYEALKTVPLGLRVVSIGIVAPVIEELCFRGVIHNRLSAWLPKWGAVLASSLLFAAVHMNLVQGLVVFPAGVLLAVVYIRAKTLWAPIILHVVNNLCSVLLVSVIEAAGVNIPEWILMLLGLFMIIIFVWLFFKSQPQAETDLRE